MPGGATASTALLPADWPAPANVHAFTTLRQGPGRSRSPFERFNLGSRCGDDAATVAGNRQSLIDVANLPSPPHWLRQVHGVQVQRFDAGHAGNAAIAESTAGPEPEGDAAVTSSPGTVLAILTADCLPVVLCTDTGGEVAVAHAGWRGLVAGVLERTVAAMHAQPVDVMAWLGPAAGPSAYEIGADVRGAFIAADAQAEAAFTSTRPGHWRVDLYTLARQRLSKAGLAEARIHGGGLCTISDPGRFYSHRRDQHTGRMATLAWFDPVPPSARTADR